MFTVENPIKMDDLRVALISRNHHVAQHLAAAASRAWAASAVGLRNALGSGHALLGCDWKPAVDGTNKVHGTEVTLFGSTSPWSLDHDLIVALEPESQHETPCFFTGWYKNLKSFDSRLPGLPGLLRT